MVDRGSTGRRAIAAAAGVAFLAAAAGVVRAHGGSIGGTRESVAVPTWLLLATGGAVVGASFLLAGFATDRGFLRSVQGWRRRIGPAAVSRLRPLGTVAGLAGLVAVLVIGVVGPSRPVENLAVLLVWAGWWAGFVMSAYLVGNAWPAVDPFRTIAAALPSLDREYPERLGAWPGVVGLLAIAYVEVVSPVADEPRLLAAAVAGYGIATITGAVVFGADTWFGTVDPIANLLSWYGRVSPVTLTDEGLALRPPGADLTEPAGVDGLGDVAFVVGVVWVTTYDGMVATGGWAAVAGTAVGAGLPPLFAYLTALLVGYGAFLGLYLAAAALARRTAETYLTTETLARLFAPSLLAIAAGYHFAHYLGFLVSLLPATVAALAAPLSPHAAPVALLPAWYGGIRFAAIVCGHMLAVWVAHACAFEQFPGRVQAIKSQYPFVAVMIGVTVFGLWIVTAPSVRPPYV